MIKMIKKAVSWYLTKAFATNAFTPSCTIPVRYLK